MLIHDARLTGHFRGRYGGPVLDLLREPWAVAWLAGMQRKLEQTPGTMAWARSCHQVPAFVLSAIATAETRLSR